MVARALGSGVITGSKNRFWNLNFFHYKLNKQNLNQSLNDHTHSK